MSVAMFFTLLKKFIIYSMRVGTNGVTYLFSESSCSKFGRLISRRLNDVIRGFKMTKGSFLNDVRHATKLGENRIGNGLNSKAREADDEHSDGSGQSKFFPFRLARLIALFDEALRRAELFFDASSRVLDALHG